MKVKRTKHELARAFHIRQGEISTLFDCGRATAVKTFDKAQLIDMDELGGNYFDHTTVRLSSVLRVLGISEEEMLKKTAE